MGKTVSCTCDVVFFIFPVVCLIIHHTGDGGVLMMAEKKERGRHSYSKLGRLVTLDGLPYVGPATFLVRFFRLVICASMQRREKKHANNRLSHALTHSLTKFSSIFFHWEYHKHQFDYIAIVIRYICVSVTEAFFVEKWVWIFYALFS